MDNTNTVLEQLSSEDFQIAQKAIPAVLQWNNLDLDSLKYILSIQEKLIVGEFLIQYEHFSSTHLAYIQQFILSNLEHEDRLFVSDLLEFATAYDLNIPIPDCLNIIKDNSEQNGECVLASLQYLHAFMGPRWIKDALPVLNTVLNSDQYYQNSQMVAALILFRLTHAQKYLDDIQDLLKKGQELNKTVLDNMLQLTYCQPPYFQPHDTLKEL